MKKILSFLTAFVICGSFSQSVISCNSSSNKFDLSKLTIDNLNNVLTYSNHPVPMFPTRPDVVSVNGAKLYKAVENEIILEYTSWFNSHNMKVTPLSLKDFSTNKPSKTTPWQIEIYNNSVFSASASPIGDFDGVQILIPYRKQNLYNDDNSLNIIVDTTNPNCKNYLNTDPNTTSIQKYNPIKGYFKKFVFTNGTLNNNVDVCFMGGDGAKYDYLLIKNVLDLSNTNQYGFNVQAGQSVASLIEKISGPDTLPAQTPFEQKINQAILQRINDAFNKHMKKLIDLKQAKPVDKSVIKLEGSVRNYIPKANITLAEIDQNGAGLTQFLRNNASLTKNQDQIFARIKISNWSILQEGYFTEPSTCVYAYLGTTS